MDRYFDCSCYSSDTAGTIQLSECSIPFQDHFMEAWNAIESGDFSSFKRSISKMKEVAYHTLTPLDVYRVVEGSGMVYAMTLLALCGFHGRYDMVNSLVDEEGARIDSGCDTCGAPLFQMMLHCHAQNHQLKLDVKMVHLFIDKGTPLNKIIKNVFEDVESESYSWSALDLLLTMNNIDLAKVLVEEGKIDPITGGCPRGEKFNVVPMFQEYCFHGTNEFISWVCNDHLPQHMRNEFTDRVLSCIESMKSHKHFEKWVFQRRTPAHAMLTCGHRETIELMVDKNRALLIDENSTGKTALHVAAEEGDIHSMKVLLDLGADCKACDNSDMTPFMIAAEKGHMDVAKTILRRDSTVVSTTTMKWALEKNLTAFFQCVRKEDLVTPIDDNGNTIVHLAAASGSTEVFKTLLDALWTRDGVNQLTVSLTNKKGRTPLQLAVEKGCIHIVKEVQDHIERGRPGTLSLWQSGLQNDWRSKIIPPLLNLACSSGSLLAVKYFIDNGYQPNIRSAVYHCMQPLQLGQRDSLKVANVYQWTDKTPLQCASEAGHDEIVEYLLQFSAVSFDPDCLNVPLLLAAANGHTKCTTLLLQKGASVLHTDENDKNCLVLAIENHHRTTALAILHDEKQGLNALNCIYNQSLTPLRLLIKEMPEIAEYALNRCIARKSEDHEHQRAADDFHDYDHPFAETKQSTRPQSTITYDFRFLDDLLSRHVYRTEGHIIDVRPRVYRQVTRKRYQTEENEVIALEETDDSEVGGITEATVPQRLKYDVENHVLKWMIRYKRLALLQHPLVKDFLFHKFWLLAYPLFLLYSVMYCILLILLTSFALVSPRPGPGSDTCPVPATKTNGTDCPGQSGADRRFLTGAAISMIFLCSVMLIIEAVQFIQRRRGCKYLQNLENYFQITLDVLIIVFVVPGFGHDCWCAHNWQWQIGALAVFLGWFNLIILLKDIPWTAIPINMFISICITFLKLIYLPLLLLLAFALPFYMIFARTSSALEEDGPGELVAFLSPSHSIAKTMVQIIGGIDFDSTFNEADLLYNPMTYILFITFLIIMPVLFINLLIGLAVGDTSKEREKANFTKLQVRVDFILEQESNSKYLRQRCKKHMSEFIKRDHEIFNYEGCFGRQQQFLAQLFLREYARHHDLVVKLTQRNEAIYNDVMGVTEVEAVNAALKQETSQLREDMKEIADGIQSLMESVKTLTEKMEGLAH